VNTLAPLDEEALAPLTYFRRLSAEAPLEVEWIDGAQMPDPYRRLLVHEGDMTSRLEAFHGGAIFLEVLHREHTPSLYRREVVLHIESSALPVEYGAIEIDLEAFEGELRELIVEARLPLGGLLNRFGLEYRSQPKGYIALGADPLMRRLFAVPEATRFFGRSNVLLDSRNRELARIVELLRP
jgi:chorismate-pyruvate lyase